MVVVYWEVLPLLKHTVLWSKYVGAYCTSSDSNNLHLEKAANVEALSDYFQNSNTVVSNRIIAIISLRTHWTTVLKFFFFDCVVVLVSIKNHNNHPGRKRKRKMKRIVQLNAIIVSRPVWKMSELLPASLALCIHCHKTPKRITRKGGSHRRRFTYLQTLGFLMTQPLENIKRTHLS